MTQSNAKFDYTEILWSIRQTVADPEPHYFQKVFPLNNKDILSKFFKPHRVTLLHQLIAVECEIAFRYIYDNYDLCVLEKYLSDYLPSTFDQTHLRSRVSIWHDNYCSRDLKMPSENTMLLSMLPLESLTDRLFHLLFRDHHFLLKFNSVLANMVRSFEKSNFSKEIERDGIIRRLSYTPKWLTRGVWKRDQGHCAYCGKDLTGIRAIETPHYDHMIALASHGTNDPVNFQLLCEKCNLEKSDRRWNPPKRDWKFW